MQLREEIPSVLERLQTTPGGEEGKILSRLCLSWFFLALEKESEIPVFGAWGIQTESGGLDLCH